MSEPKLNVGDKVYRLSNFSLRRGEKSTLVALTITSVGRKYYICGEGREPERVPIEPRPNDKPFTRHVSGRFNSIIYYLREDLAQDRFWWATNALDVKNAVQKCDDLQTMKAIKALLDAAKEQA